MQVSSGINLIAIVLPIVFLLLGLAFIKAGFLPKRRGETPHCPQCDYALVGNQSGTCPECGKPFTETTVVRGERKRNKGVGLTGIAVLLLGLGLGAGLWVVDINWYQYMPQRLVVADAGSSDPVVARRAWDELVRRRAIAPLDEEVEKKLTDLALKQQASPTPGPLVNSMLDFIAQRYLDKKLTDQQIDQFFLNAVNPSLHTREVVAAGDTVPVQITFRGRGPSNGWSYRISDKEVRMGQQIIHMGGSMGGSGLGASGSSTTYVKAPQAGEYPMEADVKLEIFHTPLGGTAPAVWSKDLTLKTTLKVSPRNANEMVKLTDRPELAELIKKSIRIEQLSKKPDGSYDMQVHIEKPPMNVAFSVFVRFGDKEYRFGDIAGDTSANMGSYMNPGKDVGNIPAGKLAVIFRSDPQVARKTVDLVEIWKGEIVLEGEMKEQGK